MTQVSSYVPVTLGFTCCPIGALSEVFFLDADKPIWRLTNKFQVTMHGRCMCDVVVNMLQAELLNWVFLSGHK